MPRQHLIRFAQISYTLPEPSHALITKCIYLFGADPNRAKLVFHSHKEVFCQI